MQSSLRIYTLDPYLLLTSITFFCSAFSFSVRVSSESLSSLDKTQSLTYLWLSQHFLDPSSSLICCVFCSGMYFTLLCFRQLFLAAVPAPRSSILASRILYIHQSSPPSRSGTNCSPSPRNRDQRASNLPPYTAKTRFLISYLHLSNRSSLYLEYDLFLSFHSSIYESLLVPKSYILDMRRICIGYACRRRKCKKASHGCNVVGGAKQR
ncbi:hypothetical protein C8F04DRAFT_1103669 [Mycena alexandri]|uniref:Uncharacterized protein n=1 Tax=Mycena alexandri TaxID=1745969 RepID=A0AAD6SUH3_9AGAR|nr:hypothetical protein C8F04DRAFT_1103669 [Mycena alexandri]